MLGGFYFHPTNGEPTPMVTIFSKQVKEESLGLSQLPVAFVYDLNQWSGESRIPPITTRYFIGGFNKKILLEHDENYCAPVDRTLRPPENICEPMNADAADIDLTAAYYLEKTNHATNATAWMISQDQVAWIQIRDNTCGVGAGPAAVPDPHDARADSPDHQTKSRAAFPASVGIRSGIWSSRDTSKSGAKPQKSIFSFVRLHQQTW